MKHTCLTLSLLISLDACLQDHQPITTPLPEAKCQLSSGNPRPYDCEFVIEKLTFLNNDGSTMGEVTPTHPNVVLNPATAKAVVPAGTSGAEQMTVDVKAVVKRVANPSFTPAAGYILNWATQPTGGFIDARGVIGDPVSIPIPIGSTQELLFELRFDFFTTGGYRMLNAPLQFFFIENDVTTTYLIHPDATQWRDKAEGSMVINPSIAN